MSETPATYQVGDPGDEQSSRMSAARAWATSEEGQEAVTRALAKARQETRALDRACHVDWRDLNRPVTALPERFNCSGPDDESRPRIVQTTGANRTRIGYTADDVEDVALGEWQLKLGIPAPSVAMAPTYEELAAAIREFASLQGNEFRSGTLGWLYGKSVEKLSALAARLPQPDPFREREINGELR